MAVDLAMRISVETIEPGYTYMENDLIVSY